MKKRATYNDIGGPNGLLANLEEFEGNSLRAHWALDTYIVVSYSTPIAEIELANGEDEGRDLYERFALDESHYSVTTRHHQTLIGAWIGQATELEGVAPSAW